MQRKHVCATLLSMFVFVFTLSSCVNKDYDLSKDLNLDITVGGDEFSIPIGGTEKIMLTKLIDESDILILDSVTKQYSISKEDAIDPVTIAIDPVNVAIAKPTITPIVIDFGDQTVENFTIADVNSSSDIHTPEVNVKDIELPVLSHEKEIGKDISSSVKGTRATSEIDLTIEEQGEIGCAFDYTYPAEVKSIEEINFGAANSENGYKMKFMLDFTQLLAVMNPQATEQTIKSFVVMFPTDFVLVKDNSSACNGNITVSGNVFTVTKAVLPNDAKLVLSFYVKSLKVKVTDTGISLKDNVNYSLTYHVKGEPTGTTAPKRLAFNLSVEEKLTLKEALLTTNVIEVDDINKTELKVAANITGLKDISAIHMVAFKDSKLTINIADPKLPLALTAGTMDIQFPERFQFGSHTLLDAETNILSIPGAELFGKKITLDVLSVNLQDIHKENDGVTLKLNEEVSYTANGLKLGAKTDLSSLSLEGLDTKKIDVDVKAGEMKIDHAEVVTDVLSAEVNVDNDETKFDVDQEVPDEITAIKRVFFSGKSPQAKLSLTFERMPSRLNKLKFSDFAVTLPKFLKFDDADNVKDGVLMLENEFDPHTGFTKTLTIKSLDFTTMKEGSLKMVKVNGKNRLIIKTDNQVTIKGALKADKTQVSSDELQQIEVVPSIDLDEMHISVVNGTVDPKIDDIKQSIALDLGTDLDFLKGDDVKLDIHNPQIMLTIGNTIGVPVELTLKMYALNIKGETIFKDIPERKMTVKAAAVDGESTTTKFLISRLGTELSDFEPIKIEELSNLLTVVPDSVSFKLTAKALGKDHRIDLTKDLKIIGNYKIVVPLQFDAIHINYKDTINGLKADLKDFTDMVKNVGVELMTVVDNTVPMELELNVIPLDADKNVIEGITVTVSGPIKAGGEEGVPGTSNITIKLKAKDDRLLDLDALELIIKGENGETKGGVPLKGDQYVQLSKIYLKIKGGLDVNLNDK